MLKSRRTLMGAVITALAVLVLGVVTLARPGTAASGNVRLTTGQIEVDGASTLTIVVYNPTGNKLTTKIRMDNITGFLPAADDFATLLVPAHGSATNNYGCTGPSACSGAAVMVGPKALAPTVLYDPLTDAATSTQHTIAAGDWRAT
jgi:hypothetical protein